MPSYTSYKYQVPLFRDCPHCKQSISSNFRYCPHCGVSLIQPTPNYIDPSIPNYVKSPKGFTPTPPEYPWQIDPPIKIDIHSEAIPNEYCPHCGQLIIRPKPLVDPLIFDGRKNYVPSNNGSCFIATACNADTETLSTFYKFRDKILLPSFFGKKLVQFYYCFSPSIAQLIQKSKILQNSILSILLKPLAALLKLTVLYPKEP